MHNLKKILNIVYCTGLSFFYFEHSHSLWLYSRHDSLWERCKNVISAHLEDLNMHESHNHALQRALHFIRANVYCFTALNVISAFYSNVKIRIRKRSAKSEMEREKSFVKLKPWFIKCCDLRRHLTDAPVNSKGHPITSQKSNDLTTLNFILSILYSIILFFYYKLTRTLFVLKQCRRRIAAMPERSIRR